MEKDQFDIFINTSIVTLKYVSGEEIKINSRDELTYLLKNGEINKSKAEELFNYFLEDQQKKVDEFYQDTTILEVRKA